MKIRTPKDKCIICASDGTPLITAIDRRGTYFAIKKMRKFLDAWAAELKERATYANTTDT